MELVLYYQVHCPKGENEKSFLQVFGKAVDLTYRNLYLLD